MGQCLSSHAHGHQASHAPLELQQARQNDVSPGEIEAAMAPDGSGDKQKAADAPKEPARVGHTDNVYRALASAACASDHALVLLDITGQHLVWCSNALISRHLSPTSALASLLGDEDMAAAVLQEVAVHGSWKGNAQGSMVDVVLAAHAQQQDLAPGSVATAYPSSINKKTLTANLSQSFEVSLKSDLSSTASKMPGHDPFKVPGSLLRSVTNHADEQSPTPAFSSTSQPLCSRFNTLIASLQQHQHQSDSMCPPAAGSQDDLCPKPASCEGDQRLGSRLLSVSPAARAVPVQSGYDCLAVYKSLDPLCVQDTEQPRVKAHSTGHVHEGHVYKGPMPVAISSKRQSSNGPAPPAPHTTTQPGLGPKTSAMLLGLDALLGNTPQKACRSSLTGHGFSSNLLKLQATSTPQKARGSSATGSLECNSSYLPDVLGPTISSSTSHGTAHPTVTPDHVMLRSSVDKYANKDTVFKPWPPEIGDAGPSGNAQAHSVPWVLQSSLYHSQPSSGDSKPCPAVQNCLLPRPSQPEDDRDTIVTHATPHSVAEVQLRIVLNPVQPNSSPPLLLVSFTDISTRCAAEQLLMQLTESQLGMVSQMFPLHVIEHLSLPRQEQQDLGLLARQHHDVTILFMDIVDFTAMSKEVEPGVVMSYLNVVFSMLDEVITAHNLHKVETAGDCYIVSSGVLEMGAGGFLQVAETHNPAQDARATIACAKAMLQITQQVPMPHNGSPTQIRIGIHTGDCTSGLIGSRLPKWSLYGDCVNTASRMESTSLPGRIQVTQATHRLLPEESWQATGGVYVKGKGNMNTYLWVPSTLSDQPAPVSGVPMRSHLMLPALPPIEEASGSHACHAQTKTEIKSSGPVTGYVVSPGGTHDLLSPGAAVEPSGKTASSLSLFSDPAEETSDDRYDDNSKPIHSQPSAGRPSHGSTSQGSRSSAYTLSRTPSVGRVSDTRAVSYVANTYAAFRCQSSRRSIDVGPAPITAEASTTHSTEHPLAGLQLVIPPANQVRCADASSPEGWRTLSHTRAGLIPQPAPSSSQVQSRNTLLLMKSRPTKSTSSINLGAGLVRPGQNEYSSPCTSQQMNPSFAMKLAKACERKGDLLMSSMRANSSAHHLSLRQPLARGHESEDGSLKTNRVPCAVSQNVTAALCEPELRNASKPGLLSFSNKCPRPASRPSSDKIYGLGSTSPSSTDKSNPLDFDVPHHMTPSKQRRSSTVCVGSPVATDFSLSALLNAAAWTAYQPPSPSPGR